MFLLLQSVVIFACAVASVTPASAAQWAQTYGGARDDVAYSVRSTGDGGYIVAGLTQSFGSGNRDAWLLKLAADGNIVWQRTYKGAAGTDDLVYAVDPTADGGYIAVGLTGAFDAGAGAWVLKLDRNGDIMWQKAYGGVNNEEFHSVRQTVDGGYIVAGVTDSFDTLNSKAWVLKLDGDGNILWQKTYRVTGFDYAEAVRQTIDGGYIVSVATSFDAWILRLSPAGDIVWQKIYQNPGTAGASSSPSSVELTADGGFIVVGSTSTPTGFLAAWLLRLDSNGNVMWQKSYGGTNQNAYGFAVLQTSDGAFVLAGRTDSFGAGAGDAWVLKLDGNGNIIWQRTYGGADTDFLLSLTISDDSGYVVAGGTYSFGAGQLDAWVLKLDANGGIGNCVIGGTSDATPASVIGSAINNTAVVKLSSASPTSSAALVGNSTAVAGPRCYFPPAAVRDIPTASRFALFALSALVLMLGAISLKGKSG